MKTSVVILCQAGVSTNIMYNFLSENIENVKLIQEKPPKRIPFLKRRAKKLGVITVLGQVVFQVFTLILRKLSSSRVEQIISDYRLNVNPPAQSSIINIENINSKYVEELLVELNPELVIISGTRIIKSNIISCINAQFVNVHCGITPAYRGVHGAYWALYNHDLDNVGVTIHLINEGVDTGGILAQKNIRVTNKDNFITYPYLQIAESLNILMGLIEHIVEGNTNLIVRNDLNSAQWYHPTIWQYLYKRLFYGIK